MNFFTKNPNLKKYILVGEGVRGARVSDFFYKESKSKKTKKLFRVGSGGGGAGLE